MTLNCKYRSKEEGKGTVQCFRDIGEDLSVCRLSSVSVGQGVSRRGQAEYVCCAASFIDSPL